MSLDTLTDALLLGRTLAPGPDGLDASGDPIAQGNLCSYHFPTLGDTHTEPAYLATQQIPGTMWAKEMNVVHPLDDDDDVSQADVTSPEAAHIAGSLAGDRGDFEVKLNATEELKETPG